MSHIQCPKCRTRNHTSIYGLACPVVGLGFRTTCDDCGLLLELVPDTDGLKSGEASDLKSKAFAALAPYRWAAGIRPRSRDKIRKLKPSWRQRVSKASRYRKWCRRQGISLADLVKADPSFDRRQWKP